VALLQISWYVGALRFAPRFRQPREMPPRWAINSHGGGLKTASAHVSFRGRGSWRAFVRRIALDLRGNGFVVTATMYMMLGRQAAVEILSPEHFTASGPCVANTMSLHPLGCPCTKCCARRRESRQNVALAIRL